MRLLSNIIKSTQVSVSSTNKFNIEVLPIYDETNSEEALEQQDDLLDEPIETITEQEILQLAEKKAEKIILNANEKANDIITKAVCDAENEAEKIREEAQKSGYELGYSCAIEQVDSLKQQAQLELENAIKQKEDILLSSEPQMVEMILNLSKTILGKAFDINPQIILLLVKKGLEQASTNGNLYTCF
jgi:flagellar assembly protein FliH